MGNGRLQREISKKEQRQKSVFKCLCVVLIISILLCGVTVLGSIFIVSGNEDMPKGTNQVLAENKDHTNRIAVKKDDAKVNSPKTEWNLLLVNPWKKLPSDFTVELTALENGHFIDKRVYSSLQTMLDAARAEGLSPIVCSSYRTQERQQALFDSQVGEYIAGGYTREAAEKKAGKWIAVPGTSEHQTGLAVDIVALSYQHLDEKQADTAEQQWLMKNSYKFGFILRYSSDKSDITGSGYEPWHYRYVGKEAAKEIYEKQISLEEYLQTEA